VKRFGAKEMAKERAGACYYVLAVKQKTKG